MILIIDLQTYFKRVKFTTSMPYSYYNRLRARDKKIYRNSDKITVVTLQNIAELSPFVGEIQIALDHAKKSHVKSATQKLATKITRQMNIAPVRINVLACRPHNNYGELHGLYEPISKRLDTAEISVWMRTAKRKQVVAYKTYMRTFLHELCHHFDYELFKLDDSFHTEGFFKRESSLYKQLINAGI